MTPQDEIEALVARVAMGDRKAFRALYAQVSPQLFGICMGLLQDQTDAEEALEEVFRQIWQTSGAFRDGGYPTAVWLARLTRDVAVARGASPARAPVGQSEEARAVADCMALLPQEQAVMIRRVYLGGLDYAALAEEAGSGFDTVRRHLRRGLASLRGCLGG